MTKITLKDIKAFGKVLEVIGKSLQERPEDIEKIFTTLGLINNSEKTNGDVLNSNEEKEFLNVFDISKSTTREQFKFILQNYDVTYLKDILRKFKLGGLKLKNKDSIIEHIIEQTAKRTTDVFRDYDMNVSNPNDSKNK